MQEDLLPAPLMTSEPGSFAEYTILKRKPQILRNVIESGMFSDRIVANLRAFADELAEGTVAPLKEDIADVPAWLDAWAPWEGKTWRQLPWYLAESYFYRRLLEITTYFQDGPFFRVDPFANEKKRELGYALADMTSIIRHIPADLSPSERVTLWLHRSLWGNRADLSNREVLEQARRAEHPSAPQLLLIDHTPVVLDLLNSGRVHRLAIITDNYGLELLSDLMLADQLLSLNLVQQITFELKLHPFFVSDATIEDLGSLLTALPGSSEKALQDLQTRLTQFAVGGRLRVSGHPFFTTSLFYSQMPDELSRFLGEADLVILKGDVNYRRLVEDRHWPPTTDLATIVDYMPCPFLALRTLKSEVIVGLEEGAAEATAAQDKNWLINGERGVIHLVLP